MKRECCKYCEGRGVVQVFLAEDNVVRKRCPVCKGEGKVSPSKNIDLKMPLWIG